MAIRRRGALSPGLGRAAPAAFSGEAARDGGTCFAEAEQGDDFGIDVHRKAYQEAGASPSSAVSRGVRVARMGDAQLGPHHGQLGLRCALGDAGIELLARLDDAHAGEAAEPALAEALDRRRHAHHQPRAGRWHEQRAGLAHRREHVGAQQGRDLAGRIGMALVEGRAVELRPQAGAGRRHGDQLAAVGHHPPDLAQERPHLLGAFDGMDQQHAVDRAVGQRQVELVDQGGVVAALARPARDALRRRHEGQGPLGLFHEGPQERGGIAQPQHGVAAHARPHLAQPRPQQADRHLAEGAGVEFVEVEDVCPHIASLAPGKGIDQ